MATRERPRDRGRRIARSDLLRLGHEIRIARMTTGCSLDIIARSAGISASQIGRIERGVLVTATLDQLARVGATVGLDIRARAYPGPDLLRDAGQAGMFERFLPRLHPALRFRAEVVIPTDGDQRAWDGMIDRFLADLLIAGPFVADPVLADPRVFGPGTAGRDAQRLPPLPRQIRDDRTLPVEAETRLTDLQAQLRRLTLKQRDAGVDHVLLLIADTRRNRQAAASASSILRAQFPIPAREMLRALRDGRYPNGSGIVFI